MAASCSHGNRGCRSRTPPFVAPVPKRWYVSGGMDEFFLGVDAGTESIRAGIYDRHGNCRGSATAANRTFFEHAGWAEQRPADWRAALEESIRAALADAGIDGRQIAGVCVDGTTCTLVFLDGEQRPLRNAIMWMDVRAADEAREASAIDHPARKYVGYGAVSAEWFPARALWVKRHEPQLYERCALILEETDWLTFLITGEVAANINTASVRWFYDARDGDYPVDFYRLMGLDDVSSRLPRPVRAIGERAGTVQPEFASATGLHAGTPVAVGGGDAWMASIGVNAIHACRVALSTGSSHALVGFSPAELHANGFFGSCPDGVVPGLHIIEGGQTSTGSVLHWFTENLVGAGIVESARTNGESVYELLNRQAADIPPGSEGLLVLEHWQGNRTPWVDPTSRGVIRGLTLRHTTAHIYRAILEGVAYGTAVIFRTMRENGFTPAGITACGGATRSDFWMQLHADITGLPITINREQQAACLGSAIAAAVAAESYPDLRTAAAAMVHPQRTVEPRAAQTEKYLPYVDQYIETYWQLRELSRRLSSTSG